MKLAPTLLTVACAIALSACTETTQNSNNTAPKETATNMGASAAQSGSATQDAISTHKAPLLPAVKVAAEPVVAVSEPVTLTSAAALKSEPKTEVQYNFPSNAPGNLTKRFIEKDVDHDGSLNLEEFTTYLAVWLAQNQPSKNAENIAPGVFRTKDVNRDGRLTPSEAY